MPEGDFHPSDRVRSRAHVFRESCSRNATNRASLPRMRASVGNKAHN